MTNEEILEHAARVNYASVRINKDARILPGSDNWQRALVELTPQQRIILAARIEHFDKMLSREQERTAE